MAKMPHFVVAFCPAVQNITRPVSSQVFITFLTRQSVETLIGLLHNPPAFTSPVNEVVAWGEDTWP
jgi:hypothetical protein